MTNRAKRLSVSKALDVGCGEGRFCRLLASVGIDAAGVDPTRAFIKAAKDLHPDGLYLVAAAENLPFDDGAYDLVVSYLSLVDIKEIRPAIAEMTRVLAPGGTLLMANLASHNSAGRWLKDEGGKPLGFLIDRYLDEQPVRQQWQGIDILNWHRPLSTYMQAFLGNRLRLTFFDEPAPAPEQDVTDGKFARAPWFVVMEWRKDESPPHD
jgi:SAM-dependent methyltransferase